MNNTMTIAVLELVGVDALFSASLVRDLSPSIEGDSIGLGRLPHRMRGVRGCANSLEYRYTDSENADAVGPPQPEVMRHADNNQCIADLLGEGVAIHSYAAGRVGPVFKVNAGLVYIRMRNGQTGVTTFNGGDPVEVVRDLSQRTAVIRNVFSDA